jgi:hypothetical protein
VWRRFRVFLDLEICADIRNALRDCRSFVLEIEHVPLAVDDLPILRDWRVDAGAAFGIDELDGLWHGIWIFAAVIQRLEPKASPIQMRVLRGLVGGQLCEPMGKFMLCPF